jgi:sugar lactone lactonase YvrE
VGQTVTAAVEPEGDYTYEWYRGDIKIDGQIQSAYTITGADAGYQLTVKVFKAGEEAASQSTGAVPGTADHPAVMISGNAEVDSTLTASVDPADESYVYAWYRGADAISGADRAAYTVTVADIGFKLTVKVSKNGAVVASRETAMVPGTAAHPLVLIEGQAFLGQTLTASVDPADAAYTYQWYRGADPISGAVSAEYTVVQADVGKKLKITVSKGGAAVAVRETAEVQAEAPPELTIAGTVKLGQVLTVSVNPAGAYTYAWYRGADAISGAVSASYTITAADIGMKLKAEVRKGGAAVAAKETAEVPAAAVTMSGDVKLGAALTAGVDPASTAYTYQWFRGADTISGAVSASYTITAADIGKRVKVTVKSGAVVLGSKETDAAVPAPVISISERVERARILKASVDPALSYTYQWYRGANVISGATSQEYTIAAADVNSTLKVEVKHGGAAVGVKERSGAIQRVLMVSDLAGSWHDDGGFANGTGAEAEFKDPMGMAADSAGNVYVADQNNHVIRKITPAGAVSVYAGTEGQWDNGSEPAKLRNPTGIAFDSQGNLFVTNYHSHNIRKITSGGTVTVFAGSAAGVRGDKQDDGETADPLDNDDGTGTAARFLHPHGLWIDANDNLYVTEDWGQRVRKITPQGEVTTVAGVGGQSGNTSSSNLNFPVDVVGDNNGNLYVVEKNNYSVRKIVIANGAMTLFAGGTKNQGETPFADGQGASATFADPIGITIDQQGNLYVADQWNNRIRKITPAGLVSTLAGGGYGGETGPAETTPDAFPLVKFVAAGPDGALYVSTNKHYIRKISLMP